MLNIIVLIKWVPRVDQMKFDPEKKTLVRIGVESQINPPDMNGIELGLQLKEKYGGKVTVLTMGPPPAKEGLEIAIGMGADEAILLTDRALAGSDTLATSYALSKAIEKIGEYDLIIAGEETTDSSTGQVGPGVATFLDISQVTYVDEVIEINKEAGIGKFKRSVDDGFEIIEAKLPALITVGVGINTPRGVTLKGKLRAKKEGVIKTWDAETVGINKDCAGFAGSPTAVAKVETVEPPPRRREIFQGDPKEAAKWLVEKMKEIGVI